jgi:endonuclease-3
MRIKERAKIILSLLDVHYPVDDKCYLYYGEPYELLIATILSAQCTDAQVNAVTRTLFEKYPTLLSFAGADITELEDDIRPAGFFRTKARHIKGSAAMLADKFNGETPSGINELTSLPGVGRKTANLVRGHIYGIPSIVVDTHVGRVSLRLGLVKSGDPTRAEFELMDVLPKTHWIRYNTQIIAHGRKICAARKPKCAECIFNAPADPSDKKILCPSADKFI